MPLDTVCVIGCALQTGVGAVLNTAQVEAGATVLIMGAGGIGIATVQGARLAGVAALIEVGINATRSGGKVVCVGAPPVEDPITIPSAVMFAITEKKLCGCLLGSSNSLQEIPRLIQLWKAGRLDLEGMITSRRPLAEVNQGLDDLARGRGIRTVLEI